MPRSRYTGATKHVTLAAARALGPRWVVQEKVDGQFARLYLDGRGRVAKAFSRNEREVHPDQLRGILGAHLGRPHAELIGELEAHTESACKAVAERGQPLVHLFDCLHDGVRSLVDLPYHARRDTLYRMQSELECTEDKRGDRKRAADGRFRAPRLTGWRVAPIIPQAPLSALERVWGDVVVDGEREGLVLVNLDARAGAPCSKLKCKPLETLDAVAVSVSRTTVTCQWRGRLFNLGRGRHHVEVGEAVEVRHCGWYEGGCLPRFPSIVRVRRDLVLQ